MEKVSEKKNKKLYTKTDIINAIEDIRQKRLTISAAIELKFVTSRVTNFFFLHSSSYDQQDSQKFAE